MAILMMSLRRFLGRRSAPTLSWIVSFILGGCDGIVDAGALLAINWAASWRLTQASLMLLQLSLLLKLLLEPFAFLQQPHLFLISAINSNALL